MACSRGTRLEGYVITSLVQLLCRTTKLCWFDDDHFRSLVEDAKSFLAKGSSGGSPVRCPCRLCAHSLLPTVVREETCIAWTRWERGKLPPKDSVRRPQTSRKGWGWPVASPNKVEIEHVFVVARRAQHVLHDMLACSVWRAFAWLRGLE
jgi:hypothetical protein